MLMCGEYMLSIDGIGSIDTVIKSLLVIRRSRLKFRSVEATTNGYGVKIKIRINGLDDEASWIAKKIESIASIASVQLLKGDC